MKAFTSRYLGRIPVGLWIRRSIGKTLTYRVRRGNGFYGSKLGEAIQDRFAYNVSDPNANHVGVANKNDFAAAVAAWQALTPEVKAWWNKEVQRLRLWMSGYNLYIRRYRLGEL